MVKLSPREIVESVCGHWPSTGCPTDGYLRHALRALGINDRGIEKRDELLRAAKKAGLDFKEKP